MRGRIVFGWTAFVVVTSHWRSWQNLIDSHLASDTRSYEAIASAAPHFPASDIPAQQAQRFAIHYLVGLASDVSGASLHLTYWVASVLALAVLVAVTDRELHRFDLPTGLHALLIGALITSPYAFRYHLVAPGLLSDTVFMAALVWTVGGLLHRRGIVVVAGMIIALLARQTALPLILPVCVWWLFGPGGAQRTLRWRASTAIAIATVGLVMYEATVLITHAFSVPYGQPLDQATILGDLSQLPSSMRELAAHWGRVALGVAPGIAMLGGALLAARLQGSRAIHGHAGWCLALATFVMIQPAVLNVGHSDLRLSALALPALLIASAAVLSTTEARLRPRGVMIVTCLIAGGSLNHKLTWFGPVTPTQFAISAGATALATVAFLGARVRSVWRLPTDA